MSMKYKFKKHLVKVRVKKRTNHYNKTINQLDKEQKKSFNMVVDLSKKNFSNIIFDPYSDEILIVLPTILVILKDLKITVQNTKGFHSTTITHDSYDLLTKIIYKEAHRERRKLKHQAQERIFKFLVDIAK